MGSIHLGHRRRRSCKEVCARTPHTTTPLKEQSPNTNKSHTRYEYTCSLFGLLEYFIHSFRSACGTFHPLCGIYWLCLREGKPLVWRWLWKSWNYSNKKQPLKIIWHGKWFFIKSVSFHAMNFSCLPFFTHTIFPGKDFYLYECVANSTKRLPIASSRASETEWNGYGIWLGPKWHHMC